MGPAGQVDFAVGGFLLPSPCGTGRGRGCLGSRRLRRNWFRSSRAIVVASPFPRPSRKGRGKVKTLDGGGSGADASWRASMSSVGADGAARRRGWSAFADHDGGGWPGGAAGRWGWPGETVKRLKTMVGATGIEPVTPTVSRWCSPAELRAHKPRRWRVPKVLGRTAQPPCGDRVAPTCARRPQAATFTARRESPAGAARGPPRPSLSSARR